jgi:hypothetical protein
MHGIHRRSCGFASRARQVSMFPDLAKSGVNGAPAEFSTGKSRDFGK